MSLVAEYRDAARLDPDHGDPLPDLVAERVEDPLEVAPCEAEEAVVVEWSAAAEAGGGKADVEAGCGEHVEGRRSDLGLEVVRERVGPQDHLAAGGGRRPRLEVRPSGFARPCPQGGYRVKPTRRVFIPKPDGRQRPLGVASLEDKILQRALVEVLNAIYECDFLGFSYGFRPGHSPHDALDALAVEITRKKVNYVLDADIRDFFTRLDQGWLERFLEHRIADKRVLRLIGKWLRAGVIEDGEWSETLEGTAQGASVSPLLANVYLHYVFDLWADQWRRQHARGDMIVVRFADDYVAGFEHRDDAERFLADLRERLAEFTLELAEEKTRLIEFGRFAAENRSSRGLRSRKRSSFWASRTSAQRPGTDGSSSNASRARRSCERSWTQSRTSCSDACTSRSPNKVAGSPESCKGTTTTTQCPTTAGRSTRSGTGSCGTGVVSLVLARTRACPS